MVSICSTIDTRSFILLKSEKISDMYVSLLDNIYCFLESSNCAHKKHNIIRFRITNHMTLLDFKEYIQHVAEMQPHNNMQIVSTYIEL